jgi:hypothetical protein
MTTTELDTLTDYLAKTNSTMFPTAEKLFYYNIGYGLLYGMVIDQQEDNYEEEDTKTTIADQRDYKQKARIHHVNWLKINYGDGFIPARYKKEADLISEYGNELETVLTNWSQSDPLYWYKGKHLFVVPAPSSSQAGADRLKASMELLPADLTAGVTPDLVENFQYLLAEYAAHRYHQNNGESDMAVLRQNNFNTGAVLMLETMFPRARQAEMIAHTPNDDGSAY